MKVHETFADEALHAAGGSTAGAKKIIAHAARFSSMLAAVAPEIAPYDFQGDFCDDYASRMTIWRKPRGVGGSWSFAMKAVGKQLALPKSGSVHLSLNMDDATEKITYAKQIYQALADVIPVPALTVDNKTEIGFENGSTIQAVFDPRGKHKRDVYWDEMAHHPQSRKIYRSAIPATLRARVQFSCGSTVFSGGTLFSEIWNGQGGRYSRFRRITTHWWDCPAHCRDVAAARIEAPGMPTAERVAAFGTEALRDFFDSMLLEDFQCEFELVELGEEDAWLPWDLILQTTPAGEAAVPNLTADEFEQYLEKHPETRVFGGYDVGRVRDTGEFSGLFATPGEQVSAERMAKTFRARSFQEQEDYLMWFMSHPNCFLAIDRGGLGMNLAEKLGQKFRGRVKEVDFGSKLRAAYEYKLDEENAKTVLAVTIKQAMLNDSVRWQVDVNKNYQMHSIRRAVTEAMRVVYRVETEGEQKHHADVFWARAMATWLWKSQDLRMIRFAAVA